MAKSSGPSPAVVMLGFAGAIVLLVGLASQPVGAVIISKPTYSSTTSQVTTTFTFENNDRFPSPTVRLILECSTSGQIIEEFGLDGSIIGTHSFTIGSALVSGSLLATLGASSGYLGGYQSGYGYDAVFGNGYATGERGFVSSGASGSGYGYLVTAAGQDLTYKFTLRPAAFVVGEACTAVTELRSTLPAGDFQSPVSDLFTPRLSSGGVGGGGGNPNPPPAPTPCCPGPPSPIPSHSPNPTPSAPPDPTDRNLDTDGDRVPDFVERLLGTDPTDPNSKPNFDLSGSLTVQFRGGVAYLRWSEPTGPGRAHFRGYQILKSNSPWVLIATITDIHQTSYEDTSPGANPSYKVTYFVDDAIGGGKATATLPDGSVAVTDIPGWDENLKGSKTQPETSPLPPTTGPGPGVRLNPWLIGLLIVAVVALVAMFLARKK